MAMGYLLVVGDQAIWILTKSTRKRSDINFAKLVERSRLQARLEVFS